MLRRDLLLPWPCQHVERAAFPNPDPSTHAPTNTHAHAQAHKNKSKSKTTRNNRIKGERRPFCFLVRTEQEAGEEEQVLFEADSISFSRN